MFDMNRIPNETDAAKERELRSAVDSLKGKSEAELFEALKSATRQERETGALDNTRMDDIYKKLAPYLTAAQKEKMRTVIARLKE